MTDSRKYTFTGEYSDMRDAEVEALRRLVKEYREIIKEMSREIIELTEPKEKREAA